MIPIPLNQERLDLFAKVAAEAAAAYTQQAYKEGQELSDITSNLLLAEAAADDARRLSEQAGE